MELFDKVETVEAKTILTRVAKAKSMYWFGNDFNMNLYRGCPHGCIYCDSRSDCYQVDHFDKVRVKKNCIEILRKELASKRARGVVSIGAMSDSYNPLEKELLITRQALELLKEYRFGVAVATKSADIVRDIDLYTEIARNYPSILKMTITSADDELSKKLEPNVSVSSKRFAALQQLSSAGLYAGVLLMPVLPQITDNEENIIRIVHMAKAAGCKFVYAYFGVTLRQNQRDYYYQKLDQLYPDLTQWYKRRYNERYSCSSPRWKQLNEVFVREMRKAGMLYRMNDIIRDYQSFSNTPEQLKLF